VIVDGENDDPSAGGVTKTPGRRSGPEWFSVNLKEFPANRHVHDGEEDAQT
jgi:hypothetical protein